MSLDFNHKDVDDKFVTSPYDKTKYHPVMMWLLYMSMPCGVNDITKANLGTVTDRYLAWQQASGRGALQTGDGEQVWITADDIENYVGLSTNASTRTVSSFNKALAAYAKDCANSNKDNQTAHEVIAAAVAANAEKKELTDG